MGTMQWLHHFRSSVRREREIPWESGIRLRSEVRAPIVATLRIFQRGLTSSGINLRTKVRQSCSPEYAECIDLYVQEKNIHAELLMKWLWAADAEPAGRILLDFGFRRFRRRFDWVRELMVLLTAEMVSMPLFRVLANSVDDPTTRALLEEILADQAYHLGFHIDHLRDELQKRSRWERLAAQQAWSALFAGSLSAVLIETSEVFDALPYDRLAFWTDAWNLFAQVQTGLHGSRHLSGMLVRDPRLKFAL
jgi:hypothetical protein